MRIVWIRYSVVSNSLWPYGLWPTKLLSPWGFPGKNTGVGCHSFLQGIFPAQGSNPGLLHCRQILYFLSHQGSTESLEVLIKHTNSKAPSLTVLEWGLGTCMFSQYLRLGGRVTMKYVNMDKHEQSDLGKWTWTFWLWWNRSGSRGRADSSWEVFAESHLC